MLALQVIGRRLDESSSDLQAQYAGVATLSERTFLMTQIVTDGHDGILITDKSTSQGKQEDQRRTEDWTSELMKLASLEDSEGNSMCLLRRLSSAQPGVLSARQLTYSDSLDFISAHNHSNLHTNDHIWFAIASKPSLSFVREFRSKTKLKLLVWTWDLIDYDQDKTRRSWFEDVIKLVDGAFLNEMGREQNLWRGRIRSRFGAERQRRGCKEADQVGEDDKGVVNDKAHEVHYVDDGTVTIGDRGGGRRPRRFPLIDTDDAVVFVGSLQGDDPLRTNALRALLNAEIKVSFPPALPSLPAPGLLHPRPTPHLHSR
eukprot:711358-Hanusia_phi.AAC.5